MLDHTPLPDSPRLRELTLRALVATLALAAPTGAPLSTTLHPQLSIFRLPS
jgi:hypothetical protein